MSIKGFKTQKGEEKYDYNFLENIPEIHVPIKGIDYWTEEDKNEIKQYIDTAILGGEW